MHLGKRIEVDANAFALTWAPKLIGFFQLFIDDQATAEALTIETLVEEARARSSLHGLLRRAVKKAEWASAPTVMPNDAIVRAVSALPLSQRTVVALIRGMSLDFNAVASVMKCNVREVKRLFADALMALHHSLQRSCQNVELRIPLESLGEERESISHRNHRVSLCPNCFGAIRQYLHA